MPYACKAELVLGGQSFLPAIYKLTEDRGGKTVRKTWGMVFAVILVVVISLAGCSKKAEGPEGKAGENEPISQIRIGYIAMPLTSPQKLIEDESQIFADLLREDDIEVEWVQTRSRDNTGEMKDKLEVDFFYLPAANYSTYFTETSDFGGSDNYRIIAGSTFNNSYVLIGRPGVEKLDDLDGKTVGVVNHSYMEEFMLNKQLETVGLKTAFIGGSVTIEHTDWMKTFQENFETGAYDAVVAWTSNQEAYLKRVEGSKVITNLNEGQVFGTHAPHVWLLARKDYIEQRPELVKTVLKAHVRATAEAQKKSKESLAESADRKSVV